MKSDTASDVSNEASYPYYDLEACIELSNSVRELGGAKTSVRKSQLAHHVRLAESTPSFFQKLSAAKVFGIIEGRGSYTLTELGRRYFYPQSEQDQVAAKLRMFSTPPAFLRIITRFDGEPLPKTEILVNIFHSEMDIPVSWKDRVAQIFNRSAAYAGIIDNGGFLRYDSALHIDSPSTGDPQPRPVAESGLSATVHTF